MNKMISLLLCMLIAFVLGGFAQEKTDSAALAMIRDEGMNRSQVMDLLSTLTDVYGPRLAWSPEYMAAAKWAEQQLKDWGLSNVHMEEGEPSGRAWTLNRYSANIIARQNFPLISYPMAWSPGVSKTAELVFVDADTITDLPAYKGKLKGKFVMLSSPREITAHFEPEATRLNESDLLELANADDPANRERRRRGMNEAWRNRALLSYEIRKMAEDEGAAGFLTESRGDGGNVFVQQASVNSHPDTPWTSRKGSYEPDAPKILPQISVGAEHYNRLVRMIRKGEKPKLELNLDVTFGQVNPMHNIIGEIPGTDLANEIVMVGGHFDSWHGGTGATDDGTGTVASMEAMRILESLNLKPRRTIRIALWDSEEQGLNGSRAYVEAHFGKRGEAPEGGGPRPVEYLPEAENFSVYFNHDNGGGKLRGVYMQGNEAVRPIFRAWLNDFDDLGASTLTLANTGGTDHLSFDAVGLPGFQFIQDRLEYGTRTHHATMDVYDRVQTDDMKQAAVIMAAFLYNAAMRDAKFPRKEMPQPRQMPGSN